jgi:hypothetical protein
VARLDHLTDQAARRDHRHAYEHPIPPALVDGEVGVEVGQVELGHLRGDLRQRVEGWREVVERVELS